MAAHDYNLEMVALLLRLDTEVPAEKFSNVVDMMDWLDREEPAAPLVDTPPSNC
jgi:hypothetical protein